MTKIWHRGYSLYGEKRYHSINIHRSRFWRIPVLNSIGILNDPTVPHNRPDLILVDKVAREKMQLDVPIPKYYQLGWKTHIRNLKCNYEDRQINTVKRVPSQRSGAENLSI